MARPKNFENMTHEERCVFWANERELAKKTAKRGSRILPQKCVRLFSIW
jgi:hypothetical protein